MFPLNVIAPELRTPLLISALLVVVVPFLALVALVLRILFDRKVIGRYTGFTLLVCWLIALGFTAFYSVKTANDFREKSTVVEERALTKRPVYHLTKNDLTVIKLPGDNTDRLASIRERAIRRNQNILEAQSRMHMRIVKVDSAQQPTVKFEYDARGATYDQAAQRAGQISYQLLQQGDSLLFDSHFHLDRQELMRDQGLRLTLNIPVGTTLLIDRDLQRHIWYLSFNQCEVNYDLTNDASPDKT